MSCSRPLFRISESKFYALPEHLRKQAVNNGIVFGRENLGYYLQYLSFEDLQQIGCGRCVQCKLKRTRDWATRIVLEAKQYEHNYFITLTYDEVNVPTAPEGVLGYVDKKGEVFNSDLRLRDIQLFIKRVRQSDIFKEHKLRIFYCGEYGELSGRPHYHLILMNSPDLTPYLQWQRSKRSCGEKLDYFKCPLLESKWLNGIVDVTSFSYNAAAYVAGYVLKKIYTNQATPQELPPGFAWRTEPFVHMSNRPGIARDYFDENFEDIYKYDEVFIKKRFKVLTLKPPRYFDKLFDSIDPLALEEIKFSRERSFKLKNTTLDELSYLENSGGIAERAQKSKKARNSEL